MQETLLETNLQALSEDLSSLIRLSSPVGDIFPSKTGVPTFKIKDIIFHSAHDPIKEAYRLIENLKPGSEEKLYIFFGAGLGYSVKIALGFPNITCVWMECDAGIFKMAFEREDFSEWLHSKKLRILLTPYTEDSLFSAFKGLGSHLTSFIPHRPSLSWKVEEYTECKFICEKFFRKKDVNIATLSKFETIWTRNLLQNIPEISEMVPVSLLFGIAKEIPILVCGAGPSLYNDLDFIKEYRNHFLLLCVDTSLNVLVNAQIDPDLIYSVDPQTINKSYLEGYEGNGKIIFDPTSCYHSLRLPGNFKSGFFTSSPFPLLKLFTNFSNIEIGDIPFGGSVSTNAVSLAEMMDAKNVLIVGQDLAFTDGYAHCRGAILEERLNYKESRLFRRELHNYRQLFALPKLNVTGLDGKIHHTNEKMQIFRKWFNDRAKNRNWINLTSNGGTIENIPISTFKKYFSENIIDTQKVSSIQKKIKDLTEDKNTYIDIPNFVSNTNSILTELESYENILKEGITLSENIYKLVKKRSESSNEFHSLLNKIEKIDEQVAEKKGLSEIIGLGVQRVILMITEGFDSTLSIEEKKNPNLSIAKKSILLYKGLYDASRLIRKTLRKSITRVQINNKFYKFNE
jgi:hypothetical protein